MNGFSTVRRVWMSVQIVFMAFGYVYTLRPYINIDSAFAIKFDVISGFNMRTLKIQTITHTHTHTHTDT